jgi:hypothetical protein
LFLVRLFLKLKISAAMAISPRFCLVRERDREAIAIPLSLVRMRASESSLLAMLSPSKRKENRKGHVAAVI